MVGKLVSFLVGGCVVVASEVLGGDGVVGKNVKLSQTDGVSVGD